MDNASVETLRNNLIPKKVGGFMWRALKGTIPVRVELDKSGIDLDSILCPVCGDEIETVNHILFSCNLARSVWESTFSWWKVSWGNFSSVSEVVSSAENSNLAASKNM